METWILVFAGIAILYAINTVSKINSKLDEILERQNEIEESVLQEVRDYGIDRGTGDDSVERAF